jgi:hypothetical protein
MIEITSLEFQNFPNLADLLNGTNLYIIQAKESRAAGAPVDSRAAGAPVD